MTGARKLIILAAIREKINYRILAGEKGDQRGPISGYRERWAIFCKA